MTYPYIRIYTDSHGETHIEEETISMERQDFSPPTPFLDVSSLQAVQSMSVLRLPPGWDADWHPSPCRQWQLYLTGSIYFEASDGRNRVVSAGEIVLLEDTTGKGHLSHAMYDEGVHLVSVRCAD